VGGCARFVFDEASENTFVCPFCGAGLEYMDNDRIVMTIEKRMGELSAAL
jgi:transcription initiation factor TFIIE subunit alpha